jgi:Protein of unknown function (DUF559)
MYKCKICGKEFEKQPSMAIHCALHYPKPKRFGRVTITKFCEKCGKAFDVIRVVWLKTGEVRIPKNEKRFDTRSCANGQPHTKKWKSNINKGLKGKTSWYKDGRSSLVKECKDCGKRLVYNNKSGFCKDCLPKHRFENREIREKLSIIMKNKAASGNLKGWITRPMLSYPETFFRKVLSDYQLLDQCEINKRVSKRALGLNSGAGYFLDFFFAKKMIDLEVDGQQHFSDPDRVRSDKDRDEVLTKNGYRVYRIKWRNINNDVGKKYIKEEIRKFLDFYNRM